MSDDTKPSYVASYHAELVLGAMQEGLGHYVVKQMQAAFQHGCERGRDDAEAEHRKELKEALEKREREVRSEMTGKKIVGLPELGRQVALAIRAVRDRVLDNEDIRGYEAVDKVMREVMALFSS